MQYLPTQVFDNGPMLAERCGLIAGSSQPTHRLLIIVLDDNAKYSACNLRTEFLTCKVLVDEILFILMTWVAKTKPRVFFG